MAPEQAAGDVTLIGPATDVFALGALLFWLLTSELPPADDLTRVSRALRDRRVTRRLRAIVTRCLAPRAADRYANAGEVAADLVRYRGGQAVDRVSRDRVRSRGPLFHDVSHVHPDRRRLHHHARDRGLHQALT